MQHKYVLEINGNSSRNYKKFFSKLDKYTRLAIRLYLWNYKKIFPKISNSFLQKDFPEE